MIFVSNTSPVTNLAAIGQLDLLKHLFGRVLIPEAVARELSAAPADTPAAPDLPNLEWIQISPVADRAWVRSLLEELHPGEAEAIVLACEKKAYLLIDENRGRRKADSLGLRHLGVLGVLIRAKRGGSHSSRPSPPRRSDHPGWLLGEPAPLRPHPI